MSKKQQTYHPAVKPAPQKGALHKAEPAVKFQKESTLLPAIGRWLPWVYAILFAIGAAFVLVVRNSDYLYGVSERSLFMADESYFRMIMVKPGALMTWMGCLLTQFFNIPELGAAMLIAIWLVTYVFTLRAFRLSRYWSVLALLPIVMLLCSETDIAYWLYYNKNLGFWFSQPLSLMLTMGAVWVARVLQEKSRPTEIVWIAGYTIMGYLLTGWMGLLASLLMVLNGITRDWRSRLIPLAVAATCIVVVPLVSYQFCAQMRLVDAWIVGFPRFQYEMNDATYTSPVLIIPFAAMAVCALILPLVPQRIDQTKLQADSGAAWGLAILQIAVLAISVAAVQEFDFQDYNYHAELRMYRAADEGRWNDVIAEAAKAPGHQTREMVLLRNIALTYTDKLGEGLFRYDNMSVAPVGIDSLDIRMIHTNAPLTYMYYAKTNFALRWAMENSVEYGFSPDTYKIMARCAIINGENDVARKHLACLKKTFFYKDWANRYEQMIDNPKRLMANHEMNYMHEYYSHYGSRLDGDEGLVEMYLLHYFSNTMNKDSKLLEETTLAFSLISKDIQLFWPRFFLYAQMHQGEQMPIHYQEAAYLYGHLEQEVDITTMPFDQQRIVDRYEQFNQMASRYMQQGKSQEEMAELIRPVFGDTFWWFYFFCRDVHSY